MRETCNIKIKLTNPQEEEADNNGTGINLAVVRKEQRRVANLTET